MAFRFASVRKDDKIRASNGVFSHRFSGLCVLEFHLFAWRVSLFAWRLFVFARGVFFAVKDEKTK